MCRFGAGTSGKRKRGARQAEGDVPAGSGETERVHQSRGERKGTPGTPEEDQEEDYRGGQPVLEAHNSETYSKMLTADCQADFSLILNQASTYTDMFTSLSTVTTS